MDCHICNQYKNIENYYHRIENGKKRYTRPCKECVKSRVKNRLKKMSKEEKRLNWNRWKAKNKDTYNKSIKLKRQTDTQFRHANIIRKRTSRYIIGKNQTNNEELYGMSKKKARDWIQYQFMDDMDWDNYATFWEFDHIIPLKCFDLTDKNQFTRAHDISNIQPLQIHDNRNKHDKYDKLKIEKKKIQYDKFNNMYE